MNRRGHNRSSFPAFKMLPKSESRRKWGGWKKVVKKMHTKKTRAMKTKYTAAHARSPMNTGVLSAGELT